jgi:transposase-like protein
LCQDLTKNAVQQCILIAVTVDADNHAVRLAWGIVESESEASWRMFLSNIKTAMPEINEPEVTIMSDRDKGLKAADDELGQTNRAYCTQHLKGNIQKNFGLAATKSFGTLGAAKTNDEYRTEFDKLSQEHPRAAVYIIKIDPQLWATPYLKGKRYDQTTSNLVEGTNSHIRRERELPIIELLNTLWITQMDKNFKRVEEIRLKYAPAESTRLAYFRPQ